MIDWNLVTAPARPPTTHDDDEEDEDSDTESDDERELAAVREPDEHE
jgi:hypothetical protein